MIVLKGVSQDVDLTGLSDGKYNNFLVFDRDGSEFRIPVPQETVQSVLKWFNQHTNVTPNGHDEPPKVVEAMEVADDDPVPEDEEEVQEDPPEDAPEDFPESEDEVDSL